MPDAMINALAMHVEGTDIVTWVAMGTAAVGVFQYIRKPIIAEIAGLKEKLKADIDGLGKLLEDRRKAEHAQYKRLELLDVQVAKCETKLEMLKQDHK